MRNLVRSLLRWGIVPALALIVGATPALGQQSKEPPPKEVTDGFFDVPARDPSLDGPEIGLGSYVMMGALAGGAIFIVCKSARRA